MQYQPKMNASEVNEFVRRVFPQSLDFGWEAREIGPGTAKVLMRITDQDLRPGGTISGPSMFALADLTAYILVLSHIGEVALAVTTNLNINFLAKPEPGDLMARGRLLKLGKRLAVCDVEINSAVDGRIVSHATATYSIPPSR